MINSLGMVTALLLVKREDSTRCLLIMYRVAISANTRRILEEERLLIESMFAYSSLLCVIQRLCYLERLSYTDYTTATQHHSYHKRTIPL